MARTFLVILFISFAVFADTSRTGNNSALIIMDMQDYFVGRTGSLSTPDNVRKLEDVTNEQVKLIQLARSQNIPVIFVEYETFGDSNKKLRDAVAGYENTRTIVKSSDSMFDPANAHLNELFESLHEKEIGTLIIAGANGGGCVQDSIRGSLGNNYNVIAYPEAIIDFNFQYFVYPYRGRFTGVADVNCDNCTFREVSSIENVTMFMNQFQRDNASGAVNDSDRSIPRRDIPFRRQRRFVSPVTTRQ